MAFLIYDRKPQSGHDLLIKTQHHFSLAGYQLIYKAWEKQGCPFDSGWKAGADELIQIWSEGAQTYDTTRLLIDFHPSSRDRIGIIELLEVFAYTYKGSGALNAAWTPLMLRLRDVYYLEFKKKISDSTKERLIQRFNKPKYGQEFVEFLYLQGHKGGWNWGRTGGTNAAFIESPARDYFRNYF
jgi:hypothetical protein